MTYSCWPSSCYSAFRRVKAIRFFSCRLTFKADGRTVLIHVVLLPSFLFSLFFFYYPFEKEIIKKKMRRFSYRIFSPFFFKLLGFS